MQTPRGLSVLCRSVWKPLLRKCCLQRDFLQRACTNLVCFLRSQMTARLLSDWLLNWRRIFSSKSRGHLVPSTAVQFPTSFGFVYAAPLFEKERRLVLAAEVADFLYPFLIHWACARS